MIADTRYKGKISQLSLLYSASETASSHSLEQFSPGTSKARWENQLSAALIGMVNMPVVAAARLKRHIVHPHLTGGEGLQIALSYKILGKSVVGSPDGEHHLFLVPGLVVIARIIVCPDLLGHVESRPGLGPSGVKGRVGQNLRDLPPGDAVLSGQSG